MEKERKEGRMNAAEKQAVSKRQREEELPGDGSEACEGQGVGGAVEDGALPSEACGVRDERAVQMQEGNRAELAAAEMIAEKAPEAGWNALSGGVGETSAVEDIRREELKAEEKRLEELRQAIEQRAVMAELRGVGMAMGLIDMDAAMKLADMSGVRVLDTGEVQGVRGVLEALKKERAYLFGINGMRPTGKKADIGGRTDEGPDAADGDMWKMRMTMGLKRE